MSRKNKELVPMLAKDIDPGIAKSMPLLGAILKNYPFVKEEDDNGDLIPLAVENNMLSQARLAGDLYVLMNVAGLTKLGKGSLEQLMCLTPRMQDYLGVDSSGQSKTLIGQSRRVSEGDHKETEIRDPESTEDG